jgi:NADH-quinone oxidoreductase subunit H
VLIVNALWKLAFIASFALTLAAVLTWLERRQSAYAQDRLGPTRAHFFRLFGRPVTLAGLMHVLADSAKMFFKEPHTPGGADVPLFRMAPMVGWTTVLVTLSLIPFGPDLAFTVDQVAGLACPSWTVAEGGECWFRTPLQVATLDAGILVVFAVGSLGVYAAALGGWASNNRFGLLGGLRASAQSVSYEVALGLTVVGVLVAFGTTELGAIAKAQDATLLGFLPAWGIFLQPVGAALFLVAGIAEAKRIPFDLPEGESEIVGYFVEYSSMGFGLFMLAEFAEVVLLSMVFTTLFLGGWQAPFIGESSVYLGFTVVEGPIAVAIAGVVVFCAKTIFMCVFQLQVRWTLPRFRYDQVMHLGWKIMLPIALGNIFVTALLVWWDPTLDILATVSAVAIVLFVLVVIAGPRRQLVHGR